MSRVETDFGPPLALAAASHRHEAWTIFAGRSTGLFRRELGDEKWEAVEIPGVEAASVTALTSVGADAGGPMVLAGTIGGILRSEGSGSTWTTHSLGSPPPVVTCFAKWPTETRVCPLVAGTLEDGVYCSTDGGSTWASANTGLLDMAVYSLCGVSGSSAGGLVIAGTETGVFVSENGGRSWQDTGFDSGDFPVQAIACTQSADLLVAGTGGGDLIRSTDGGATWTAIRGRLSVADIRAIYVVEGEDSPPMIVVALDDGIVVSLDKGSEWRPLEVGMRNGERIISSCLIGRSREGIDLAIGLETGEVRVVTGASFQSDSRK